MTVRFFLARTREELSDALGEAGAAGRRVPSSRPGVPGVALVPTMGALHEGHASLMTAARATGADLVVTSIFVNPTQFARGEDLDRYPRTLEADLALCEREGVDVVFAPTVGEVYPGRDGRAGSQVVEGVSVDPGPLGGILEGASRPAHFRGVLTVVAKLFGLVRPELAVFGEKDYQQLVVIRQMARDLLLGVEVVGAPTVREPDGLALSSRNRFLDAPSRAAATALSRALFAGREAAYDGSEAALAAAREVLSREPAVDLDYLALTDPDLGPPPGSGEARMLVAARVGGTRLIDNVAITIAGTIGGNA